MKIVRYVIYSCLCFVMYGIIAILISNSYIFSTNESELQCQLLGLVLVFNYFATAYIRNLLIYILKIKRKNPFKYIADSSNTFENIITFLSSVFSTTIIYFLFKNTNISDDMKIILPTINFIFSWIVNGVETRRNKKCNIFDIIVKQKNKIEPWIKPLIFCLIWAIPVLIICIIYKDKLYYKNMQSTTWLYFIIPYIYALIIAIIFSLYNRKHSLKVNDMDKRGYSYNAELFNSIFMYELHILIFGLTIFIANNIIGLNEIAYDTILFLSFISSVIFMQLVKKTNFGCCHDRGPNGEYYEREPYDFSSYKPKAVEDKEDKDDKDWDWSYKENYVKDSNGRLIQTKTTHTNFGGWIDRTKVEAYDCETGKKITDLEINKW